MLGQIANFAQNEAGIWVVTLPEAKDGAWKFETISVNGELRHLPRLPKTGHYVIAGLAGADPKAKYNTPANKFEFAAGEISPKWHNLNDVEAVVLHFWVDVHLKIASVDEAARVVTFDFREQGPDGLRFNSFAAKRARGMVARYICEHRIDRVEDLRNFDSDGYQFDPASEGDLWRFVRN